MAERGTGPKTATILRQIPAVEELLHQECVQALLRVHPRWVVLDAVRETLSALREQLLRESRKGKAEPEGINLPHLLDRIRLETTRRARPSLRRLINATGIVLHTNIGRAPLSAAAVARLEEVARHYSTLELDLETGERGSRQVHVESLLRRLTGGEAALAVNNNAAAVLLAVNTLAEGQEVVVSRGELVEIGGSFRIPDVMGKAGATLREVGTTNRTHLRDYATARSERTALFLKVHPSNFRIEGFTAEVPLSALVALGRPHALPVMFDMGSGALIDLSPHGLTAEPTVGEALRAGADLVTFSGDKLLGGPQAGLLVGKAEIIARCRKNPLARAVRIDKLSLAALEATLTTYLDQDRVAVELPTLRMISASGLEVRERAQAVLAALGETSSGGFRVDLEEERARVGGGALPTESLPTTCVVLIPEALPAERLEAALRAAEPPVLGRIRDNKVLLDMRTVQTEEVPLLIGILRHLMDQE
ncbi:MAG: L-seryl-tRNA(Sec) selenium transferase [Candidatus Methylomirabilia bacterium]